MALSIDQMVEQAYQMIDDQPNYTIPRLELWKKTHNLGIKKVSACQGCGTPILHATDKIPLRCTACRKKISDLFKKRKEKSKNR